MFFGIAVFAFEGNGVIQSIHNSMQDPQYFYPVLRILMAVIISIVVSVATIGYSVSYYRTLKLLIRAMEIRYWTWSLLIYHIMVSQ